jgi:hypothetical protein
MRCPHCRKTIGYFTADQPPRCPRTGRLVDLATTTHGHKSELGWWRPVDAALTGGPSGMVVRFADQRAGRGGRSCRTGGRAARSVRSDDGLAVVP